MSEENIEESIDGSEKQSLVRRAIIEEIQEKAQKALKYKRSRDEAKTNSKREFYERKLKHNNEDVPALLQALQRLSDIEEAKREQALNEDGNTEGTGLEVQETSGSDSVGGDVERTPDEC